MNSHAHTDINLSDRLNHACLARGKQSHYLPEDEAWTLAWEESRKIGVTRIADITGYDRVGIPVYNSIKPTTSGSSVQHGKGLTRMASKISALMESLERFNSVNPDIKAFEATYDEVARDMAVIPFERLLHIKGALLRKDMPILWTVGWDLANQVETAAPLAMVELAGKRSQNRTFRTGHMQASSNGLAAGFHLLEAISQALLEIIERDGITCHTFKSGSLNLPVPEKWIDHESIPYPEVGELVETFINAGITPHLYDCTTDIGIPVYNCFLFDNREPEYMCVHGMGAGLRSRDAMVRALTESAQSRAVFNAGCRDLLFREEFEITSCSSSQSVFRVARKQKKYTFDPENEIEETNDYSQQIRYYIDRLKSVGLGQVLAFPLVPETETIQVVRVIVPGAEGYTVSSYHPRARAYDYLKGVKS